MRALFDLSIAFAVVFLCFEDLDIAHESAAYTAILAGFHRKRPNIKQTPFRNRVT